MLTQRNVCLLVCLAAFCESVVYGFSFPYFSLRLEQQGVSAALIGLHAAVGTTGVLLFGRTFPPVIARLGYRNATCSAFAMSAALLCISLVLDSVAWSFVIRLLLGICFAGIWVCTEAWINHVVSNEHRGKVNASFQALYSFGFFLGPIATYATGFEGRTPVVFMGTLMLIGLAVLMTIRNTGAQSHDEPPARTRTLVSSARGILFISMLIGLAETALFALLPVYGVRQGMSTDLAVSLLVAYSMGEILIALPIGWMADRMDRGHLLTACAFAAAAAVFLLLTVTDSKVSAWLIAALAGGAVVSLHNIALILLGEQYRGANLPIVSTAFSMAYALGSAGGSAIGGVAMAWLGPAGLPLFVGMSLLAFGAYRFRSRRPSSLLKTP
jgi:MFS family permease